MMTSSSEPDSSPKADLRDLPLPDPYPEYLACPHCGEPEVEIYCFQPRARCHACGGWVEHTRPPCFGSEHCWAILSGLKE